jgi:hypothetical protein
MQLGTNLKGISAINKLVGFLHLQEIKFTFISPPYPT